MGDYFVSSIIIDDFLQDFDGFRSHLDGVDYDGITNPEDGVFYPGVSLDILPSVKAEVIERLQSKFGQSIIPGAMFLRLSPLNVPTPHQAHTDPTMGEFGMMLYVNRLEDCMGGTSFENPINEAQRLIWERDTNQTNSWGVLDICSMKPNRAMIFNTSLMHRSEPVGGFGKGAEDGRLVLVFFFDAEAGQ